MIRALWANIDYVASVVLFLIGLYAVIAKNNLIKKFMGINIMETAVFALIISVGTVRHGSPPIAIIVAASATTTIAYDAR